MSQKIALVFNKIELAAIHILFDRGLSDRVGRLPVLTSWQTSTATYNDQRPKTSRIIFILVNRFIIDLSQRQRSYLGILFFAWLAKANSLNKSEPVTLVRLCGDCRTTRPFGWRRMIMENLI